ncbi:MAG: ferrochelatase [Candidatus Hydrogenedentes bacterium]|nr:ferrochelatase [Candidatus Hydrogenedentota bacterium]
MTAPKARDGVLLINTGSSAAPEVPETRAYLRQFLSDPRVIDIPAWKRSLIVNCFILPFRPKYTAHAYKSIWTPEGSPLIAISKAVAKALDEKLEDAVVTVGMAYGSPSIEAGMELLVEHGVRRIIVVPMFPQYASATTGSVVCGTFEAAAKRWNVPPITVMPPFYKEEVYLNAWVEVARPELEAFQPDHVLLSYHGLPVRQIYKGDPSGSYCLKEKGCCERETPQNQYCYRHHCITTANALVQRLGLQEGKYSITFQSRLGRDPWLEPATDMTIKRLADEGVKRLAILSPAFVADCLETLEELGMQGRDSFLAHGGKDFLLVPSLNTNPAWVDALATLVCAV